MTTANPTFTAASLPRSVAWLGYGGLLPFLLPALIAPFDPAHGSVWLDIQRAYGAIILSFVGALHWAFAMQPGIADDDRHRHFIWSVVPALIGWLALILPAFSGLLLLLVGFWAHFLRDRRLATPAGLPAWYLPLRLRLTGIASLCLLSALSLPWWVAP